MNVAIMNLARKRFEAGLHGLSYRRMDVRQCIVAAKSTRKALSYVT